MARNMVWMILGQGLRLIIQALYFVEMARSLGVRNYGAFIGVVAFIGIVYPFGALGSGSLLVKNVARDHTAFPACWGRTLAITLTFGSVLVLLALALSRFVLPAEIPLSLVAMVALSDVLGLNLITQAGQAFQAFEKLNWTAAINVMMSAGRLIGAIILVAMHPHPTADQWGYIYFGCTIAVTGVSLTLVRVLLGSPRLVWKHLFSETREGFYFSAGLTSQTVYNDIDKTMLARLDTLSAAGVYGAAYRLIDVSFVPVSAALSSAYPSFFRAGTRGISGSLAYAKPLMLRAATYALAVFVLLMASSGLVPLVLGSEYAATAAALRWLSILPVLKALHYFFSDTLTSSGYQGVRTAIQASVALLNVLLNLWIIPAYSWRGAAWSSIACDATLAMAVCSAVYVIGRSKAEASKSHEKELIEGVEGRATRKAALPAESDLLNGSAAD